MADTDDYRKVSILVTPPRMLSAAVVVRLDRAGVNGAGAAAGVSANEH